MARKGKDEVDFSKLSRKERRDEARKMLFGDFKESERTNIWGKKFSLFSLAGLTVVGVIAIISVKTGHIDPQNLPEDEPYLYQHFLRKDQPVKDTLN
jgi:hypothetical protein